MTDKILYAKQIDEEPIHNIPIAKEPGVIIGEYIETNNLENSILNTELINKCWYYSINIRFITGIDIILGFINGFFFNPFLFLTCIIPLCGYQGATQFCTIKTMLYLIYSYTTTFSRFIEACKLINYSTDNSTLLNSTIINSTVIKYEDDVNLPSRVLIIVGICQLFISVYISIFLCKLYKLNKYDIFVLKSKIKEKQINESLCC
jgi:hypothetical protein